LFCYIPEKTAPSDEVRYVATTIIHFGEELYDRFSPLRDAGYSIFRYEKLLAFREVLQSGTGHDAVSLADLKQGESPLVIQTARTYSRAPLILFRTGNVIPFPASDSKENAGFEFDLVIPPAPPSTWISDVEELIARSRQLLRQSQQLSENSVQLCQEAPAVRAKTQFEKRRAQLQRARCGLSVAASPSLVDKLLKCTACGAEFVFTAGEQAFFQTRKFANDPKSCKQCRSERRNGNPSARLETILTCAECQALTSVPFKPYRGRPVLCHACFQKIRNRI
jgi:CxxC-x17-CxxC domain-containing protein